MVEVQVNENMVPCKEVAEIIRQACEEALELLQRRGPSAGPPAAAKRRGEQADGVKEVQAS